MQHDLYLKDPALIACVRGWALVAEGYRLNVALSLHAIQMVSSHSPPCRLLSQHLNWKSHQILHIITTVGIAAPAWAGCRGQCCCLTPVGRSCVGLKHLIQLHMSDRP